MSCLQEGHATEQLQTTCNKMQQHSNISRRSIRLAYTVHASHRWPPLAWRLALRPETTNTDGLSAQEVTLGSLL